MQDKNWNWIKSFVIGSSLPVFLYYFIRVYYLEHKTYSYFSYTLINPIYFGCMNVLAKYLIHKTRQSPEKIYLLTSVVSPIIVFIVANIFESYDWNNKNKYEYFLTLLVTHIITYNLVIQNLERIM